MKLPPDNLLIPPRGAAVRGVFYTQTRNGQLVIAKWPRRRPAPATPREGAARKKIALYGWATIFMAAQLQIFSRMIAARTVLHDRDLLTMSLHNRLCYIVDRDGRRYFTMPAMQDVSLMLDVFAQDPGAVLLRGSTFWEAILPGAIGDVLTVDVDGLPAWAPQGGGGAGGSLWHSTFGSNSPTAWTINTATAGVPLLPLADLTVTAIRAPLDPDFAGHTYRAAIYELDGSKTIVSIVASVDAVIASTGVQTATWFLPVPAALLAGTLYGIAITDLDAATGATRVKMFGWTAAGTGHPLFPQLDADPISTPAQQYLQLASVLPAVGNTFGSASFASPQLALRAATAV